MRDRCQRESLLAYHRLHRAASSEGWSSALRWVQWAPPSDPDDAWLTLGIDPDLPARDWPRRFGAGCHGQDVPLRCVPAREVARAQGGGVLLKHREYDLGNGTLGALLRPDTPGAGHWALTAGHALASSGLAQRFDPIDLHAGGVALGTGRLHRWAPSFDADDRKASLDAAVVRIDDDTAMLLRAHGPLPVGTGDAAAGQRLRLLARGARWPARAVGRLSTFVRTGFAEEIRYELIDGLVYQVDEGTLPGDSGAALWDEQDRLVAIHTGSMPEGAAGNAVATPIRRVLNWFGASVLTRSGSAGAPPGPAAPLAELSPPGSATAPPREPTTAADVLARTMWGEARGEGEAGMAAVAHVVFNRRDAQRWWGRSIEAVCQKPFQFSCWNAGDRNRSQLLVVRAARNAEFAAALAMAERLLALKAAERVRADTTRGATHYHARSLSPLPNWARGQVPCFELGRHLFYRDIA